MSLTQKIREIQQTAGSEKNTDYAWRHNEEIIAILKEMGLFRMPAPKTYITEGYAPPPKYNEYPIAKIKSQTSV